MSKDEMEALADLDTAQLDHRTLAALRYVEHLTINRGKVLESKLLRDVQGLYTDRQVRYLENGWAFANGINRIDNASYGVLRRLRIVSHTKLRAGEPPKPVEEQQPT